MSYHKTDAEAFWPKVDKTPGLGPKGDCWFWRGSIYPNGYGQIRRKGFGYAHRFSMMLAGAQIGPEDLVLHKCVGSRSCVNPSHLYIGDLADNMRDRDNEGRTPKGVGIRNAKFTAEDVVFIRHLKWGRHSGITKHLAEVFGVTKSVLLDAYSGRQWKHV